MTDGCRGLTQAVEWGGALAVVVAIVVLIARGHRHTSPRETVRQAAIVAAGLIIYFGVRHLTEGSEVTALRHAESVFDFEQTLGLDIESDIQSAFSGSSCASRALNWVYIWWHWPVILVAAIWLLLWHRPVFYRYRNAMLISGGIGLVIFATFPVAPPRLVTDLGLTDTVTQHSEAYRVFQPKAFTNQFAAMPSLHFGWNLLIGVAIAKTARGWLRVAGILMPLAMLIAVIATANHFVLDTVAGTALALLGLAIATHGGALLGRVRPYADRRA